MKNFSLLLIIIVTTVFVNAQNKVISFKDCSPQQFKQSLDTTKNYVLIDLRSTKSYKKSRINNAIHAEDIQVLFKILSKYNKTISVFVYSEDGDESLTAAAMLMRKGFNKIFNLKEGIDAWYGEGYRLNKEKINNTDLVKL